MLPKTCKVSFKFFPTVWDFIEKFVPRVGLFERKIYWPGGQPGKNGYLRGNRLHKLFDMMGCTENERLLLKQLRATYLTRALGSRCTIRFS